MHSLVWVRPCRGIPEATRRARFRLWAWEEAAWLMGLPGDPSIGDTPNAKNSSRPQKGPQESAVSYRGVSYPYDGDGRVQTGNG